MNTQRIDEKKWGNEKKKNQKNQKNLLKSILCSQLLSPDNPIMSRETIVNGCTVFYIEILHKILRLY